MHIRKAEEIKSTLCGMNCQRFFIMKEGRKEGRKECLLKQMPV